MRSRLGLALDADSVRAVVVRGRRLRWAASAPYGDAADLADAIAHLAAECPIRVRDARLAVSWPLAQLRVTEFPHRLSHREIIDHVRLAQRQFFLQNGSPLVVGALLLEKIPDSDSRSVVLVAVALDLLEATATGIAAAGLRLTNAAPACIWLLRSQAIALSLSEQVEDGTAFLAACAAASSDSPSISLMPPSQQAAERSRLDATVRRWALASAAALALATTSEIVAVDRARRNADLELSTMASALLRVEGIRRDLDRATGALTLFDARTKSRSVRLLADVARALPPEAFLTALRWEAGDRVVLSGLAPRSSAAIAALERAPGVSRARLSGAVTRETVGPREYDRFTAELSIRWSTQ